MQSHMLADAGVAPTSHPQQSPVLTAIALLRSAPAQPAEPLRAVPEPPVVLQPRAVPEPHAVPEPRLMPEPRAVPAPAVAAAAEAQMIPAEVPVVSSVRPRSHTETGWVGDAIRRLGLVDPEVAGRVIVGLLLLQGDLIDDELTYDLAIIDGDCYSVTVTEEATVVNRIPVPRPIAGIDGRIETTLEALGEMPVTGRLRTAMRTGPVKVRGRRRKRVLAALRAVAQAPVGLADLRRAGIELEGDLLLATVAAGIVADWTIGHRFTIGFDTGERAAPGGPQHFLRVNDGGPVALSCGLPLDIPTSSLSCAPDELARLLLGHPVDGSPTLAGERAPFMLLQGWVTRLESGRG